MHYTSVVGSGQHSVSVSKEHRNRLRTRPREEQGNKVCLLNHHVQLGGSLETLATQPALNMSSLLITTRFCKTVAAEEARTEGS